MFSHASADTANLTRLLEAGPLPAQGQPALPAHVGVIALDAETGQELFAWQADEAYTPASNAKLMSTFAALYGLGPDFRFETALLAAPLEGGRTARLVLRGSGDPSLTVSGPDNSLEALARAAYAAGVREVGEIVADDSAYALPRWGNGWMWDDWEYTVSALSLRDEASTYGVLYLTEADEKDGTRLEVDAVVKPEVQPLRVAALLRKELEKAGVRVTGAERRGTAATGDRPLAAVRSETLHRLVRATNKPSDNIYAEQLFARLGVGQSEGGVIPATFARAAEAATALWKKAGADPLRMRLRDASGLSRYNLLTPREVAAVLRYAYLNPLEEEPRSASPRAAFDAGRNLFVRSLPRAGTGTATPAAAEEGGTLANRLRDTGLEVYAKTGSMTGVNSLSGYLRAQSGRIVVFSLLMDGSLSSAASLRNLQDALVKEMALAF